MKSIVNGGCVDIKWNGPDHASCNTERSQVYFDLKYPSFELTMKLQTKPHFKL